MVSNNMPRKRTANPHRCHRLRAEYRHRRGEHDAAPFQQVQLIKNVKTVLFSTKKMLPLYSKIQKLDTDEVISIITIPAWCVDTEYAAPGLYTVQPSKLYIHATCADPRACCQCRASAHAVFTCFTYALCLRGEWRDSPVVRHDDADSRSQPPVFRAGTSGIYQRWLYPSLQLVQR